MEFYPKLYSWRYSIWGLLCDFVRVFPPANSTPRASLSTWSSRRLDKGHEKATVIFRGESLAIYNNHNLVFPHTPMEWIISTMRRSQPGKPICIS